VTEEQGQQSEIEAEVEAQELDETEEVSVEPPAEEGEEDELVDELVVLRQELDKARTQEAEYLDGWQRARAELSNARKRFQREQEQAYGNAKADVLIRLLPIVDDLERAFETLPGNLSSLTWTEGLRLVQHKFQVLLEQEGVVPIEAAGQEFDPFLHQAVTHEQSDEVPAGHVIGELQKGYRVSDRVLRPSVVRVSAGAPEQEPEVEVEAAEAAAEEAEAEGGETE
jgi:molecular chaperone GrpE